MIGYYHNRDLDGFSSGAIMKRKFPNAEFIGYDYGQPFEVPIGVPVMMADVSLPMSIMFKVAQASNFQFLWIDHHASAIQEYQNWLLDINRNQEDKTLSPFKAVLQDGIAACEIAWGYFFPDESMPLAIKLLGEYDTWRNQDKVRWENEILPFQFGMRQVCNSLENFPMHLLEKGAESQVQKIIENGKVILAYQAQINEVQCKKAFEFEFEGLRAICLNGGGFNSDVFKTVYDETKHDIMMPFQWTGKFWTISLYTTKNEVDCSIIAKSKGGGGHKKAAGFQVQDIRTVFSSL
jgi:oligoribonuclease NrnB/cAMP/cGMP phosphodiesterase (DHH superfamily)